MIADASSSGKLKGPSANPARADERVLLPPAKLSPLAYEVVHEVPGRLRLRVPRIKKDASLSDRLVAFLVEQSGVTGARVSSTCASIVVTYDRERVSPSQVVAWVGRAAITATTRVVRRSAPPRAVSMLSGAAALALSFAGAPAAISVGLLAIGALPILARAVHAIVHERRISVEVLDVVTIGVLGGQGNLVASTLAATLIEGGEYIRALTARRSHAALSELLSTTGHHAWIARGDRRLRVPVEALAVNDTVIVYPGALIPVDGTVVQGRATVEQKMLTGESTPVLKTVGQPVFASTVVTDGKLQIRAEKVGAATRASQIVQILDSAPVYDTRIANYAGRFADRLVIPTILLAGGVYAVTGNFTRSVAILVFDLATGIRVSAPTTVLSAMTAAARRDLLVKGGRPLERLTQVDVLVFDKTGTLTRGAPELVAAESTSEGYSADDVLRLAAAAEQRLSHPAAEAIVRAATSRGLEIPVRRDSHYAVGLGVTAELDDATVLVGSGRFFASRGIRIPDEALRREEREGRLGATTVFVARDNRVIGFLAYADVPRPEASDVLRRLRARGIRKLVMVTGDHPAVADAVARHVGIDQVEAGVFPEQKAEIVRALQRQGHVVGVIGDGINDSPALAYADVSFSLKAGTDVARETADVVLHGNLHGLVDAIDLAHETMGLIRQNLAIVAAPNLAGLALATAGILGPVASTAINNGTTVIAATNALRPILSGPGKITTARDP